MWHRPRTGNRFSARRITRNDPRDRRYLISPSRQLHACRRWAIHVAIRGADEETKRIFSIANEAADEANYNLVALFGGKRGLCTGYPSDFRREARIERHSEDRWLSLLCCPGSALN